MNVLTPVGILVFSALILLFLQLVPGVFALFVHFATGKFSRAKAADLTTFFILGAEVAVTIFFLLAYFLLCISPAIIPVLDSDIFAWVIAGVFTALALIILVLYYRRGHGAQLFISRRLAQSYHTKITTTKSRSDAFVLGFASTLPELIFTAPLFLVSALQIMRLDLTGFERAGIIILFALITILPLFIWHIFTTTGHTLADFTRFRFKNKPFFRFCLTLFYFLVAVLLVLGVLL